MRKSFFCYCFFLTLFFSFLDSVDANTIKKIEMDIYINEQGDAIVTEVWNASLYEGTEGYRTFTNLGNAYISNFSVTDEKNKVYNNIDNWNSASSFYEKSNKSGVKTKSNDVELCFGISRYGNRTYTLKYTINNFVIQYNDVQGIYFNFIDFDQNIEDVKIVIRSDIDFSLNNSRIWAFGYDGVISFNDGNIILDSEGRLNVIEYMVGLIKFEENFFDTNNIVDKSFDDDYKSAMSSIDIKKEIDILFVLKFILSFGLILLVVILLNIRSRRNGCFTNRYSGISRRKGGGGRSYKSGGKSAGGSSGGGFR